MVPGARRGFLAHERSPKYSDDRTTLEQGQVQGDLRYFTGGESDHQEPSVPSQTAECRFAVFSTDSIIDHVHALVVGELLDSLAQIFGFVIDHFVGPELFVSGE